MIRTINIILAITSMMALAGVYALKYSVEETAAGKVALERKIERQKGDLSLLKADWSYLNQPGHVGPIVERHQAALNLQPVAATQFASIDAIPMRAQQTDTQALDDLFKSLESGVDPANAGTGGR